MTRLAAAVVGSSIVGAVVFDSTAVVVGRSWKRTAVVHRALS